MENIALQPTVEEQAKDVQDKKGEVTALLNYFKDRHGRCRANFLWRRGNRSFYRINFWNDDVTDAVVLDSAFVYIEPTNSSDEWVIEEKTIDGKRVSDKEYFEGLANDRKRNKK